jgi:hypothetical protein
MRKKIWRPCEKSRVGDTARSYLLRLRAGQGVCSEIDRSQSGIPMSSVAPRDIVRIGKMGLMRGQMQAMIEAIDRAG